MDERGSEGNASAGKQTQCTKIEIPRLKRGDHYRLPIPAKLLLFNLRELLAFLYQCTSARGQLLDRLLMRPIKYRPGILGRVRAHQHSGGGNKLTTILVVTAALSPGSSHFIDIDKP